MIVIYLMTMKYQKDTGLLYKYNKYKNGLNYIKKAFFIA